MEGGGRGEGGREGGRGEGGREGGRMEGRGKEGGGREGGRRKGRRGEGGEGERSNCILTAGQMFEGPPQVMLSSLKKVTALPHNTLVFPGHEYAVKDVRFATNLLPDRKPVQVT